MEAPTEWTERTGESSVRKERHGSDKRWTEGKPWEIAWGELLWEGAIWSDDKVDGRETVGNSLGRAPVGTGMTTGWTEGKPWEIAWGAPVGRSNLGATTGWTEGKPWEIAWEKFRGGKERYRSDDRVDGRETVGNSLGRVPWGRSDTEVTRGWKEEEIGEIAWGELRSEISRTEKKPWEIGWGESPGGKERCGSDEKLDGEETVGNSLGRAPVGRSDTGPTTGWTEGKPWQGGRMGNRRK